MSVIDNALQTLLKMASTEILWENASPKSSFAAQTIRISGLQDYDFIVATFAYSTGAYPSVSVIISTDVGENAAANIPGSVVGRRNATVQSNGIKFAEANRMTTYGGNAVTDNAVIIPRLIIGMKLKNNS